MSIYSSRRNFLRSSGILLGAGLLKSGTMLASGQQQRKVVIVGAGLAGLCCAYELSKYGFEVVVLEGQGRAGGRVQTLREGLDPGLAAEAGATRIPDTHDLTLSYVNEFGLTLEPFHGGDLADVLHLRGRNYVASHDAEPDWPLNLSAEERRLGREGLAERYLIAPLKLAKGGESSPGVPKSILEQDGLTLGDYLKKQGLSSDAIELLTLGGDTSFSVALLLWWSSTSRYRSSTFISVEATISFRRRSLGNLAERFGTDAEW